MSRSCSLFAASHGLHCKQNNHSPEGNMVVGGGHGPRDFFEEVRGPWFGDESRPATEDAERIEKIRALMRPAFLVEEEPDLQLTQSSKPLRAPWAAVLMGSVSRVQTPASWMFFATTLGRAVLGDGLLDHLRVDDGDLGRGDARDGRRREGGDADHEDGEDAEDSDSGLHSVQYVLQSFLPETGGFYSILHT